MDQRTLQLSFTGGEISPELYGRPDATQYSTGAAKLSNWVVKPQGPIRTRPGFRHVAYSEGLGANTSVVRSTKLIPFVYSTTDSVVIELGNRPDAWQTLASGSHAYLRFYTRGRGLKWANPAVLGDASLGVNATADRLDFISAHGFDPDDEITLIPEFTGTLPSGYSPGTTYYANGAGDDLTTKRLQLYTSTGASGLVPLSGGSGNIYAYKTADLPPAFTDDPDSSSIFVQEDDVYTVGDLVYWNGAGGTYQSGIYYCRTGHTPSLNPASDNYFNARAGDGYWHPQPADGTLELILQSASNVAPSQIAQVVWRQKGNFVWVANGSRSEPLLQIQRISEVLWAAKIPSFNARVSAPTNLSSTADRGDAFEITSSRNVDGGNASLQIGFAQYAQVVTGDAVYIDDITGFTLDPPSTADLRLTNNAGAHTAFTPGVYIVSKVIAASSYGTSVFTVQTKDGKRRLTTNAAFGSSGSLFTYYSSIDADDSQEYQISSIDDLDLESAPSDTVTQNGQVLSVRGATNTLTWTAAAGAQRYRIYRKLGGLFGYVGESDTTTFVDRNFAPDLGRTPPIDDPTITDGLATSTRRPGAIGGHEQRMFLGGTEDLLQTVWASKPGTDLDFTYTLPVLPDNRLRFTLASSQSHIVKHIVAADDLIILSQNGQWRIRATDNAALTPETLVVRQEGFIGASELQPITTEDSVVYVAARGGHLRRIAPGPRGGSINSDLSIRAAHLFDELSINGLTTSAAPFPVVWATSSSGKLLGLTFVPEEKVSGWHQHTTEGTFVDCCVVPEWDQDVLYVSVVRQDSTGADTRSVERMQEWLANDGSQSTACLDDHTLRDVGALGEGASAWDNPYSAYLRLATASSAVQWSAGASISLFGRNSDATQVVTAFDPSDVGDDVWLYAGTAKYRAHITSYVDRNQVTATLLDDLPTSDQVLFAPHNWRFMRKRVYIPSRFAQRATTIVADGAVSTSTATASPQLPNAYVDLAAGAETVSVGDSYTCDMQTLPVAVQVEAAGFGKEKNIDRAWVRVLDSSSLQIGPSADSLVPISTLQTGPVLQTGEQRTLVSPSWSEDGQLLIRQSLPFPATVLSLTAQVSLGS